MQQWRKRLAVPNESESSFVSTCEEEIFSGAMDIGTCPVMAIGEVDKTRTTVSVLHGPSDIGAERTCGVSNWRQGLILAQFPMYLTRTWTWDKGSHLDARLLLA